MLRRRHERRPTGLSGTLPRVAERAANAAAEAREAADRAKWDAARVAERVANAPADAREAADRAKWDATRVAERAANAAAEAREAATEAERAAESRPGNGG